MDMIELLCTAVKREASDLHLSAAMPPLIRIDGELIAINSHPLDNEKVQALLFQLMNANQQKTFSNGVECDFAFTIPNVARFRVNVYHQHRGISAAFRVIPMRVPSIDDLGLPKIFSDLASKSNGLILVTGPTGSGKTTTLAAMIDYVNQHFYHHIITIEDPIEFIHNCKKCLIHQREIYRDTHCFENALRAALREDPNLILIGEMRDLETIRLALTAAETGHLVFATLHTTSAATTVNRIIDVFPGEEKALVRILLSNTLEAVISQTLVKRKGGGRIALHEIMICNSAIRNLIRENKIPQINSVLQTGWQYGMQTKDQHLKKLIAAELID
jgi:twitching motility protein PilT